jgi:hypothetical protein
VNDAARLGEMIGGDRYLALAAETVTPWHGTEK